MAVLCLQELAQLDSQVGDAKILLQMDNSRDLDLDLILRNVDAWYQSIAQRSKEEANAFYENRVSWGYCYIGYIFKHG